MHIFYLPEAAEGIVKLSEEESKHAIRVLRLNAGDPVVVTNGKGYFFDASLVVAHPKQALLSLQQPKPGPDHRPFRLHLAVAATKNADRMEWFVEKATEIGIDEISFILTAHSERKHVNAERMEKIAVSAMKQSLKSRLPIINPQKIFTEFLQNQFQDQAFIAWIDDNVKDLLSTSYQSGMDCTILIGPEGDFAQEEVQAALNAGFRPVSLGNSRLRTETAAMVSVHTIHLINQISR